MDKICRDKDRGKCSNDNMEVDGHRNIGRPKLRWSDVIRKDMKKKGVQREEAQDRRTWRMKTRCAYPKTWKRTKQGFQHNYHSI